MKTIILFGLRRSGNHYIISTIMQQFKNIVHINDVELSLEKYKKFKNINIDKNKKRIDNEWVGFKGTDCVIISLENKNINFNQINKFKNINDCYLLLLLRSPYTNFSSIWKVYEKELDRKDRLKEVVDKWSIYAKNFNEKNILVKILYDEFSIDKNYRNKILNRIGINNIKIDNNFNIKYQESSYDDKSKSQQVYKSLNTCIYKCDKEFINIVKRGSINKLWIDIVKGQNLLHRFKNN